MKQAGTILPTLKSLAISEVYNVELLRLVGWRVASKKRVKHDGRYLNGSGFRGGPGCDCCEMALG